MTDLQSARAWLAGRRPQNAAGADADERLCEWHMTHALIVASSHVELVTTKAGEVIGMHCLRCGASVSRVGLSRLAELRAARARLASEARKQKHAETLARIPETCARDGCDKPVRAVVVARKDGWGRARRYCSAKCREKVRSQRATAKRRAHAKAQAEGSRDVKV